MNLKPKTRCPYCKMLYWKKHTCHSQQRKKDNSNISSRSKRVYLDSHKEGKSANLEHIPKLMNSHSADNIGKIKSRSFDLTREDSKLPLKTLKDIDINYRTSRGTYENILRQEAIKWIKHFNDDIASAYTKDWIKYFFNLTEEDLKDE